MDEMLDRQIKLIGQTATDRLDAARVAVIGLGGVGGAALEGLARAGVGHLFVMDRDVFEYSNLNRQILATQQTMGLPKSEVAKARVLAIHPGVEITAVCGSFDAKEDGGLFDFGPDWVIDAIDSVTAKLVLIEACKDRGIPVISCMGTGNRLEANFAVGDIGETTACGCPLARVMRRELRKRGIESVLVLYGKTPPEETGQRTPASISYVPPIAGFMLAGHVIRALLEKMDG